MTIALNPDVPVNVLEGVASGIQNSATYAIPSVGTQVEWQTVFGTPPASITVLIQTSIDGSNWNTAATTTVVGGSEGNFLTSAKFIRARIDAISGGANLTVILNAKKVTAQIITGSGVPGGTDGQVQFNDAGAFGGISEGDSGQVLTSNGAGTPPSFEDASDGGIDELTGDVTAGPGSGAQAATITNVPAAALANLSFFGNLLHNPTWVFPLISGIGTGDIDIYTVPASKRAVVIYSSLFNNSGGAITVIPEVKNSGTYYRLASSSGSINANTGVNVTNAFLLAAGETFALNTTGTGINGQIAVLEFDDTSPYELYANYGPATTTHTVATAGAGEILLFGPLPVLPFLSHLGSFAAAVLATTSDASSFNFFMYHVPSGGSIVAANRISVTFALTGNSASNSAAGCSMGVDENESIGINVSVSSAAAMLRMGYWRLPK